MDHHSHRSIFHLPHWDLFDKLNPFNKEEEPILEGLKGLYLNASLRTFGVSLISIFIPLYIFDITGELYWVFVFYIFQSSMLLILDYPLAWVVSKIKPDLSALISNFLLMFSLVVLQMAENNPDLLILVAGINAVRRPLYWLPYHLSFVNLGKRRKMGSEVGVMKIVGKVASALAPLIGGWGIHQWGFDFIFNFALFVVFFSVIPLFFDSYNKREQISSLPKIIKDIFSPKNVQETLGFLGEGMEPFIATVFWPLFLFQAVKSYELVGLITSVSLVFSLITLALLKEHVDQQEKKFFRFGMFGNVLNWGARMFASTTSQFFLSNISYNLLTLLVWMPFNSIFYKKAKKKNTFDFILKREMLLHFSRLMVAVSVMFIWHFTRSFYLIFLVAALALFMAQQMVRD